MPSTYTLNNGIELIGTGEQSGTWGDTTNTNLELLDSALDGQVTVTLASAGSSGSPNTLPISDGAASNGRNRMVVFDDSSDLGATAYVQLTPNDAEKIIYIRNDLSGSRSIILFQGTYNASNDYEVPAGTTAVVYFDGAGSGAVAANVFNNAHFDAMNVVGNITVGGTLDAATVEFDNLSGTGAVSVTNILDEDDMASDSATALATQQSIKAYVDATAAAQNELSEVLANGNTTGGTDIAVSSGDDITFADSSKAIFGAGSDLQIYHDGSNSYIEDGGAGRLNVKTNVFRVYNAAGDEISANFVQDGAVTLYHDGAAKLATTSTGIDVTGLTVANGVSNTSATIGSSGTTTLSIFSQGRVDATTLSEGASGAELMVGSSNPLTLGTASTDRLNIASNGDISFYEDTGTTAKLTWDASDESLNFADNGKAIFGAGSDLQIYHDGTHSYVSDQGTGNLRLLAANFQVNTSGNDGTYIRAGNSDDVELFYGGTGGSVKLATTATGIDVTGTVTMDGGSTSGDFTFGDNDKAIFGAGSDLQIYHDGSHSYIDDAGTGNLYIKATNFRINNAGNTQQILAANDGADVQLYHNGSLKLATTSTGIDVTGTVTADGLTVDDTSTKTYPTTASFTATPGIYQNIELGTDQIVNPTTPGGFNYVDGITNTLTKSAGNTQDIERLYFTGFDQKFDWDDLNTCKQYASFTDTFFYNGIDANGRTTSSINVGQLRLEPPDGGTQTISGVTAYTVNLWNLAAGTRTINIGSVTQLSSGPVRVLGATGTMNATITNLYGLLLQAPTLGGGLTITNNWAIRQESSDAKNWFASESNQFPNITTTASGANAFLDTSDSNRLYVSTSSIEYKTDVEDIDTPNADNILNLRPVWYRSTASADPSDWSYYGLIAEEVAEVEPRLVHYGYRPSDYEGYTYFEDVPIDDSDPSKTEQVERTGRRVKDGATPAPNGVAYDRLSVMLLDIIKRQEQRITDLEARLTAANL